MAGKASLADLVTGHEFQGIPVDFSADRVQKYLDALDAAPLDASHARVPPAAAATFALSALLDQFELPGGTLHPSIEVRVHRPQLLGADTSCTARVTGRSRRGEMTVLVFEFSLISPPDADTVTVEGSATLLVPEPA